ncbi:hypothetical protein HNP82_001136 [Catenibacillus scindens]|uniref:Uncharacterized protein n=1 Tax=Catenibacillus scindens TaxID=673271 RepID=A0A7W8H8V9_9FIRM|nr:hypothetical protein [Catenibacillus scindens]MBB5264031.1 hypothetical protein [Catenibacillus scindens]
MKQIILPVTVHLNIRLPQALLQPEPIPVTERRNPYGILQELDRHQPYIP